MYRLFFEDNTSTKKTIENCVLRSAFFEIFKYLQARKETKKEKNCLQQT
jgi:hypothetical protein